ncbi:pyruvate dehydrogenase complex E1 component subunit beta [Sagittula sp. SSi028]|uniref:pyruvate dehydrogenase complex E1 component subunit beta n=1 Tax=Sagittula sp. SSi028 TaxID=3400636 RepID=UPI003AF8BC52
MTSEVLMPALSPTMEEGTLARWLVKVGDTVAAGDVIAEIETDKATLDFEAETAGVVQQLLVAQGTADVPVGSAIAILAANADVVPAQAVPAPSPVALTAAPTDWPAGTATRVQTVREALRDAIAEEMRRDSDVFMMGEEVGDYQGAFKISQGLLEEFGRKRVVDTPVTEHGFAGVAVGAAFAGLRPVVEFMTFNFALSAMDPIINSAAKTRYMSGGALNCPIVFRGPHGTAPRVGAQHSQDFAAWFAHIPGLKVCAPYSAACAKGLLKSAIRDPDPVIFLENETLYGQAFEVPVDPDFTVPLGKARVARTGTDVTIVSFGGGMVRALDAAETLAHDGLSAEVIDLRSLRPLDLDTVIASVRKTNRCVTVEDGFATGSIGATIASGLMQAAFDDLDAPVICLTGQDIPMPYAANLERSALVSTEDVIAAVKQVAYR